MSNVSMQFSVQHFKTFLTSEILLHSGIATGWGRQIDEQKFFPMKQLFTMVGYEVENLKLFTMVGYEVGNLNGPLMHVT